MMWRRVFFVFLIFTATALASCGDGIINGEEECDDGNVFSGDGCSSDCVKENGWNCTNNIIDNPQTTCEPICGDGLVVGSEPCDGGASGTVGCYANCTLVPGYNCTGEPSVCAPVCGDGKVISPQEQCDDNNNDPGDGCSPTCRTEVGWYCTGSPSVCTTLCSDGFVAGTEECDDGNTFPTDGCDEHCRINDGYECFNPVNGSSICNPICGDGIILGIETCDDKNNVSGDGCSSVCQMEFGWECSSEPSQCRPVCGDGFLRGSETCDDKNKLNGDGCSAFCLIEPAWNCTGEPSFCQPICGNGNVTFVPGRPLISEECDDGNLINDDGCNDECKIERGWVCDGAPSLCNEVCGNAITTIGEECDDGNQIAGDGCYNCDIENGWNCTLNQNQRSICFGICGNGVVTVGEACDDGNLVDGDGCTSLCRVELNWRCVGSPSNCTFEPPIDAVINEDSNAGVIAGAVVPTILALGAIGVAIIYILWRRNRKVLVKPDLKVIAFGNDATADVEPISPQKRQTLEELAALVLAEDRVFVSSLCEVTQSTELDKLSKSLTYIFYKHDRMLEFLKYRVLKEIDVSETENTLFRANSIASKVFTGYSKLIGLEYLWETLGLFTFELNEIATGNTGKNVKGSVGQKSLIGSASVELDPNRMKDDDDSVANILQLQIFAHKMWRAVMTSQHNIPSEFRTLFHYIVQEMPRKYSDRSAIYKAVGGFFFLRFICPSITTPHVYGLLKDPPVESVQRYLVLLSKIMQNIANGVLPGKKEAYMATMNDFISSHIKEGEEFFEKISTDPVTDTVISIEKYEVPERALDNAMLFLHKHTNMNFNKIAAYLDTDPNGGAIKSKLKALLEQ